MKFSCYKSDLAEALQFVIRAVAVKPMTPILAGILIRADGSTLELQANNFSTGIIARIPVSTEDPGEVVVSGKRFQEFVKNMPDDTITFYVENSMLRLESGGASVELLTMNSGDFPTVKTPEMNNAFKIQTIMLRDLIRKTVFAATKSENDRPVFTGCCFEIKDKQLSLVATNTHRLSLAKENLTDSYTDCNFVVPAETLRGIMSRIDPKDAANYVTISYSTRFLTVAFDNVFMNSRLIDGEFPPYDKVIPSSSTTNVIVDTAEFKRVVEFISLMSKETEYNTVKFVFSEGNIEISSNSPEVGGAVQNVEAELDGDDLEIYFNVDYIADVLKVVETKQLNIALNDKYSPAAFTEPDNNNYVYIATPVRA